MIFPLKPLSIQDFPLRPLITRALGASPWTIWHGADPTFGPCDLVHGRNFRIHTKKQICDVCKYAYMYIGRRLGVPRKPIAFYLYRYGTCWFTLCFTVFYAFPWKCSISQSFNVGADKLDVCPRRKMITLHLPWMAKHVCNIETIGKAVSCIFVCTYTVCIYIILYYIMGGDCCGRLFFNYCCQVFN